jgi:hypothetical protein
MTKEERDDVQELLAHPEKSAGGLMTTEHVALRPQATVAEALAAIRRHEPDAEVAFAVYVVDGKRRLLGEVTLRDLVRWLACALALVVGALLAAALVAPRSASAACELLFSRAACAVLAAAKRAASGEWLWAAEL